MGHRLIGRPTLAPVESDDLLDEDPQLFEHRFVQPILHGDRRLKLRSPIRPKIGVVGKMKDRDDAVGIWDDRLVGPQAASLPVWYTQAGSSDGLKFLRFR